MIDPILARPLASLDPVPMILPTWSMPAVTSDDQARFQAALRATPEPIITPATAMPADQVATPGDLILHGLERLRARYHDVGAAMESALRPQSAISPQELIGLQMQVAQVTLGTQLIGQIASKLEQNLNTLLKGS